MPQPKVKLSALREIGWEVWDPIGIREFVGDDYAGGPADEYDSYLLVAFGMAKNGKSEVEIADYLSDIASDHMGLGQSKDGGRAELETAKKLVQLAA